MDTIDVRCKYASKPCFYVRSIKTNGQFHTLCDHHRARANSTQRRWHKRQCRGTHGTEASDATTFEDGTVSSSSPAPTSASEPSSPCESLPQHTIVKVSLASSITSAKSIKVRSLPSTKSSTRMTREARRGRITFRDHPGLATAPAPLSPLPLDFCDASNDWTTAIDVDTATFLLPVANSDSTAAVERGQILPDSFEQFLDELYMDTDMSLVPSLLAHSVDTSVV